MSPSKLRSIRLDDHYNGMLEWFAEQFQREPNEIIRLALDQLNMDYGAMLGSARTFIAQLRERFGEDAVLEFRPSSNPKYPAEDFCEVYVEGEPIDELIAPLGMTRTESGAFGPHRALYLQSQRWEGRPTPNLYIGTIDPNSAAHVSIALADLKAEQQEYGSLLAARGRSAHHMIWSGKAGRMLTDEELDSTD